VSCVLLPFGLPLCGKWFVRMTPLGGWSRLHSSLGYLSPIEFMKNDRNEEQEEIKSDVA